MAISILSQKEQCAKSEPLPERLIYHLSLDRSFAHICADSKKCEFFLSVLANLTSDREEILYRQEIIKDFESNPELFDQLMSLSLRFEELRASQKSALKEQFRINVTANASLDSSKNILQSRALCLKRALLFIKAYGELLSAYKISSQGLTFLLAASREIYEDPEFSRLITFCSKYENFTSRGFLDFSYSLNDEGRICKYELIDHKYIHVTDPELKNKGFSLFKKSDETAYPCVRLKQDIDGYFERLSVSGLSELSGLFQNISEQIFEKFSLIGRELVFYEVALKYINALSDKKAPICYPTFLDEDYINVQGLYDLFLLITMPNATNVISNDFVMKNKNGGLLVFGNNGSGKTVYLRSIGTMQVLAQAGLPIPCHHAQLTLFSQLATQFSEAEKEFAEGNEAGRFEQEVRELAAMVDALKEGSLVFLNETFQSTAYDEGADALYHLLKHFSALNIRWILVSHLRQIKEMFSPDEVTILHTKEGYKIG